MIRKPTPDDVLDAASDFFGCERDALLAGSREHSRFQPRRLFWLLLRENTLLSYPEIARLGGGKWSHSTVFAGVRAMYRKIESDEWMACKGGTVRPSVAHRVITHDIRDRCSEQWYEQQEAA